MLLLLLSHFSHVQLCVTPETAAHQALPVPGILQARTLEWVAISFSNARKWKVRVKLLSRVWLFATPWTAAYQAPPSMGFSRLENVLEWDAIAFSVKGSYLHTNQRNPSCGVFPWTVKQKLPEPEEMCWRVQAGFPGPLVFSAVRGLQGHERTRGLCRTLFADRLLRAGRPQ